jgi:predicted Zn-dependent protease
VIGHEIAHVVKRHAVAQQAIARTLTPFTSPWRNAAQTASYSRDMEREADTEGQRLCAAAGYDPRALYTLILPHFRGQFHVRSFDPSSYSTGLL